MEDHLSTPDKVVLLCINTTCYFMWSSITHGITHLSWHNTWPYCPDTTHDHFALIPQPTIFPHTTMVSIPYTTMPFTMTSIPYTIMPFTMTSIPYTTRTITMTSIPHITMTFTMISIMYTTMPFYTLSCTESVGIRPPLFPATIHKINT